MRRLIVGLQPEGTVPGFHLFLFGGIIIRTFSTSPPGATFLSESPGLTLC